MMQQNQDRKLAHSVLALRILVGVIFAFSAAAKIIWPTPDQVTFLAETIPGDFSFHTLTLISVLGTSFEGLIGTGLLFFSQKTRAFAAVAACFTVVWIGMSLRAPTDDCGCFGEIIELSNTTHRAILAILLSASFGLLWMHKKFIAN
jgi:hypothetical protein